MKKRLIDATDWDSFYNDLGDSRNTMDSYDRGYTDALDRVDDWMDAQPTVDAVEVVHGRWIVRAEFNNGERVIAACSNCNDQGEVRTNRNEWGIWHIDSPYCPNCGAKMDGDGNG